MKSKKRTPQKVSTVDQILSDKERSILTDESAYLASELNKLRKRKTEDLPTETKGRPHSFTIGLEDYDIELRLSQYFEPILFISITTPKAEVYLAQLSNEKIPEAIASDF